MEEQQQATESRGAGSAGYAIFLLRIWRSEEGEPWRVALIKANGEEISYFTSLTQLFASLWQQLR